MNIKTKLCVAVAASICCVNVLASAALGQAGDIASGASYHMTKGDSASYFKVGKEGAVVFACQLTGDNVKAVLYGGKNFALNLPATLAPGYNGDFTWKLHDLGEETGNIKIRLIKGESADIQCQSQ
jgi:hypothetical protein